MLASRASRLQRGRSVTLRASCVPALLVVFLVAIPVLATAVVLLDEQQRDSELWPALGVGGAFGKWVGTVHLRYDPTGAHDEYADSQLMMDMLREATDRWARVSGIRFDIALAGSQPSRADDVPVIWEHDTASRWAGRAGPQPGQFDNSLGYFPYSGGNVRLNSDATWQHGKLGMLRVLTHELGHLIGLGHSDNPQSTMFANPYNRLQHPMEDDIRAVQTLYGEPTEPLSPHMSLNEWLYMPPPAATANKTRYLFKPNQHPNMNTGDRIYLDNPSNPSVSHLDDSTPVGSTVWFAGAIGNFENLSAIDVPARLKMIHPSGYLYASTPMILSCAARQACIRPAFVDHADVMRTQPGLWRLFIVEDEEHIDNPQLLFSTSMMVDTWTEYNRAPEARVLIEAGNTEQSVRLQVVVDDPEGDNINVIWHLPGQRIDRNGNGFLDNFLLESLGQASQTAWQDVSYPDPGDYEFFIQVNDDSFRYDGSNQGSSNAGPGFQTLLKVSLTLPFTGTPAANVVSSFVPVRNERYLGAINGVKSDAGYELPYQRIGAIAEGYERLYSCLQVYTRDQPDPAFGGNLDVTFAITSLEQGALRLIANRHSQSVSGANPSLARCSGRFETSTGIYRDIIRLGTQVFDASFRLTDETALTFELASGDELQRSQ